MNFSDDDDDDFFNIGPSEADYDYDANNVVVSSNSIFEEKNEKNKDNLKGSVHESVVLEPLRTSKDKIINPDKGGSHDDGNNSSDPEFIPNNKEYRKKNMRKTESKTENENKRGRKRDRSEDSVYSLSSSSSSRSRSSSIDNEIKRSKLPPRTIVDDENMDFFRELEEDSKTPELQPRTISINDGSKSPYNNETSVPNQSSSTISPVNSDPKRIYKIRFLSKLEGTINKSVQVKVLGKYTFEKILPPALTGLIKAYKVPSIMKRFYKPEKISLYRNESMKLFKFMNCNSLNIPQSFENEISDVEIVLVSSNKEAEYEEQIDDSIFDDNDDITSITNRVTGNLTPLKNSKSPNAFEEELKDNNSNNDDASNNVSTEPGQNDEPLMKLALLGQDNKRIYVNVRNSTPFSKLVDYYRIQKKLPQSAKIILLFDHDELDLNECVKDQDMEDEDVIDVMVK